jgi:hypothetical protein
MSIRLSAVTSIRNEEERLAACLDHVTFADADSVAARAQLAADAGLRGVIFWRLGGEDPALWERIPKRIYRAWLPILSDGQSGSKSPHRPAD